MSEVVEIEDNLQCLHCRFEHLNTRTIFQCISKYKFINVLMSQEHSNLGIYYIKPLEVQYFREQQTFTELQI